jgi:hypothetical protein
VHNEDESVVFSADVSIMSGTSREEHGENQSSRASDAGKLRERTQQSLLDELDERRQSNREERLKQRRRNLEKEASNSPTVNVGTATKRNKEKKRNGFKDNTLLEDSKVARQGDSDAARKQKGNAIRMKHRENAAAAAAAGTSEINPTEPNKSVRDEAARALAEVEKAEKRAATEQQTEKDCDAADDDDDL